MPDAFSITVELDRRYGYRHPGEETVTYYGPGKTEIPIAMGINLQRERKIDHPQAAERLAIEDGLPLVATLEETGPLNLMASGGIHADPVAYEEIAITLNTQTMIVPRIIARALDQLGYVAEAEPVEGAGVIHDDPDGNTATNGEAEEGAPGGGMPGDGVIHDDPLPEDFPHRDKLIAAGYTTRARLDAATEQDITAIDGIGRVSYQDIMREFSRWP